MTEFNPNNPRGSVWHKWDLHVHTPASYQQNFSDEWGVYIENLKEAAVEHNISAIATSDYFTIKGYEEIKENYCTEIDGYPTLRLEDDSYLFVIPGLELRLENFTEEENAINLHIVFDPELEVETISDNFVEDLNIAYQDQEELKCKKSNLIKIGHAENNNGEFKPNLTISDFSKEEKEEFVNQALNTITLKRRNLKKQLESLRKLLEGLSNSSDMYKIIVAKKGHGSLNELDWYDDLKNKSRSGNTKGVFLNYSDICFSNNIEDRDFLLGKKADTPKEEILNRFSGLKPCVWGSDSENESNLLHPSCGNTFDYTWIKSDLTFSGLNQITFEPNYRVKIQKETPYSDYKKPYFSKISIKEDIEVFKEDGGSNVLFEENELPLNRDMVSIIGGRGSGKSILVDYFADCFDLTESTKSGNFTNSKDFVVNYKKNDGSNVSYSKNKENNQDFVYIRQNQVKDAIEGENKDLGSEVKDMLNIPDLSFPEDLQNEIEDIQSDITQIEKWFDRENEEGDKVNDKKRVENKIDEYDDLLETITTEENKEKLEIYTNNIEDINNLKKEQRNISDLIQKILKVESGLNKELEKYDIEKVNLDKQKSKLKLKIWQKDEEIEEKKEKNVSIKEEFENDGFEGTLSSLLDNAEKYREKKGDFEEKLEEINKKEEDLEELKEKKRNYGNKIKSELERQINKIDDAWENLLEGNADWNEEQKKLMEDILDNRGIKIYGKINFDKENFYEILKEDYLNLRHFPQPNRMEKIKREFGIENVDDYFDFIEEGLLQMEEEEFISGVEKLSNLFLMLKNRSKYLKVEPVVEYKGSKIENTSAGEKGTTYLCLKLATNPFYSPLIFDQPEDDLDNEFITEDLIDIFRKIKKYRQVIIVTHNANLVVNTDSDQVIVAQNKGEEMEKLTYHSGALENESINEDVCNILEGGKDAFEKRKDKYSEIK
ncbi:MAG: TrlF family AAA-like ATPase [Candidatus Magasanikbacteria bacterium]